MWSLILQHLPGMFCGAMVALPLGILVGVLLATDYDDLFDQVRR